MAARGDHVDIVTKLLDSGADSGIKDKVRNSFMLKEVLSINALRA